MDPPLPTLVLRAALGRFATGVTIVTARSGDGAAIGLTVNSFAALSLEPPLILWSLRRSSPNLDAFRAASHFAVNVLATDQIELARRFASPVADKFAAGDWARGLDGVPVLGGCVAVLECEQESNQVVGDHLLFIGRIQRVAESARAPLVFLAGRYRTLGEAL